MIRCADILQSPDAEIPNEDRPVMTHSHPVLPPEPKAGPQSRTARTFEEVDLQVEISVLEGSCSPEATQSSGS